MDVIWNVIQDVWKQFLDVMSTFRPAIDLLDILIFAYLLYKLWGLISETRAQQLLKGILLLGIAYFLALRLHMTTLSWLLDSVFENALIVVAVIFHPEIRSVLERVGRSNLTTLSHNLTAEQAQEEMEHCLDSVCRACQSMGNSKTGALIVLERTTALGDIVDTGTVIDAVVSKDLISNIFFSKSPLHDGALVIRGMRVYSAGCILPLTSNTELASDLGTRHRAAIGMTEISDAVVIVVSEETGTISVAQNGAITRDYNVITLRNALNAAMLGDQTEGKKTVLRRIFKGRKK